MKKNKSKVLALKYRPRVFKDLIGQEIIAETILNAIKINKTPNAYLLTGIRGVGKTTTARLIAKALNCLKESKEELICKNNDVNGVSKFMTDAVSTVAQLWLLGPQAV